MNQLTVLSNTVLTMSSLEIAELTGKQHKNVLPDFFNPAAAARAWAEQYELAQKLAKLALGLEKHHE